MRLTGGKRDLKAKPSGKLDETDRAMFAILDKYCTRDSMVMLKRREGQFRDRSVVVWRKK